MKSLQTLCLLLCATTLFSGCSFVFVNTAPAQEHWEDSPALSTCTDSNFAPMADMYMVGVHSIATAFALQQVQEDSINHLNFFVLMSEVIFLSMHMGSAIYGNAKTDQCKEYLTYKTYMLHNNNQPPYPVAGPPSPQIIEDESER